ncbi:unnamed protein product [Symbiodinium pilosum]|uniref:Uncharacterized protein n=1 Tax=Symbiodinium pilosum TaxID=2952 RepID=A0A812Y2A7_SYMPI|nr:unnamed protein product [Symbiodinium pilosum]
MHSPEILAYANVTAAGNRQYAEEHGYGFHILDHVIDHSRVPHWSKIHAILIHLADYDFVFWIDADAVIYDQTKTLEEVFDIDSHLDAEIFAQDIWPDFPSMQREELMDGATVLFRNSPWTRQFLLEMYYFPECQEYLNWTEQYCLTVAHKHDLMGMKSKTVILPTPRVNHHRIPSALEQRSLFVFHYAGRSTMARTRHFQLLHEGFQSTFQSSRYQDFWSFHELFRRQQFGGLASIQLCVFGFGDRHQMFLEGLLFHFPYITGFIVVLQGAPGVYTQMQKSDRIGEKFGTRMAALDIREYQLGRTRDGKEFVKSFFCDLLVVGVESWRHLPQGAPALVPFVTQGLDPYQGERGHGFGYSAVKDAFFILLDDGCEVNNSGMTAKEGAALDKDDETGKDLESACKFMEQLYVALARVAGEVKQDSKRFLDEDTDLYSPLAAEEGARTGAADPVIRSEPTSWGIETLGKATLARVPRMAFI